MTIIPQSLIDRAKQEGACHESIKWLEKSPRTFEDLLEYSFEWAKWATRLLTTSALAEYKKVTAPALAEYKKVTASALAKYDRVTTPALAEYEKVTAPAWAEYKKVAVPALLKALETL